MVVLDPSISAQNGFIGNVIQQATSVVTDTDQDCYEYASGCYSVYGFEVGIYLLYDHYINCVPVQARWAHILSAVKLS